MTQRRTVVSGSWAVLLATAAVVVGLAQVATTRATRAQEPASEPGPASKSAAGPASDESRVSDLSARYRFIERYAPAAQQTTGAAQPGGIGQYRVANRDVLRVETEKGQGAPDRKETIVQVIYTEKPVEVNSSGVVTSLVRRYDAYRVSPQPPEAKPSSPKPLEGLDVWVQPRPGGQPLVLSLKNDHPLTETEYTIGTKYLMSMPELSGVLPALPSHVGDRWGVSRGAAQALLGDRPTEQARSLAAELVDVRKAPNGTDSVAVIRVTGNAKLPPLGSDTLLNAQVLFKFPTPAAPAPGPGGGNAGPATTIDARGAITDVRLARTSTSGVPGSKGRLRRTFTWELTLQRDLIRTGDPLPVPPKPEPTPVNSWLTYDDPKGRFHFRHPQDLHPKPDEDPEGDGSLQLLDDRTGSLDGRVVTLVLQNKTGDPAKDRDNRDPEFHKKDLDENWQRNKRDVLKGPAGWLPEAEWSPHKMKVYRIQAAERPSGPAARDVPRIFLDHYLILFTQNESLAVDAITGQDPPTAFRKQVEDILKTFALGPSTGPKG